MLTGRWITHLIVQVLVRRLDRDVTGPASVVKAKYHKDVFMNHKLDFSLLLVLDSSFYFSERECASCRWLSPEHVCGCVAFFFFFFFFFCSSLITFAGSTHRCYSVDARVI